MRANQRAAQTPPAGRAADQQVSRPSSAGGYDTTDHWMRYYLEYRCLEVNNVDNKYCWNLFGPNLRPETNSKISGRIVPQRPIPYAIISITTLLAPIYYPAGRYLPDPYFAACHPTAQRLYRTHASRSKLSHAQAPSSPECQLAATSYQPFHSFLRLYRTS